MLKNKTQIFMKTTKKSRAKKSEYRTIHRRQKLKKIHCRKLISSQSAYQIFPESFFQFSEFIILEKTDEI